MQPVPLPEKLLQHLEGVPGFNRETFIQTHQSGEQVTSVRLNPAKTVNGQWSMVNQRSAIDHSPFTIHPIPWSSYGYYLSERPSFTLDPLFHAGVYYVQEASSMFLEQALQQTTDTTQPLRVLDLCAAPGGKSTLLQSFLSADSLLVSNEVIKSRSSILEENMIRWGAANVIITNNDPQALGRLENFFDVIVIDAPCSGSGLFRRDPEAIKEWSEHNVQLCCQRQQRILADVYPALKQDGVLIYSTCSYSREEDEDVLDWMGEQFAVESLRLKVPDEWNIVEVHAAKHTLSGYRFYPDRLKGEGFFIACMRKQDGGAAVLKPPKKTLLQKLSKKEAAVVLPWLKQDHNMQLWLQGDRVIAFPAALETELLYTAAHLYIRNAGITVGKIAGNNLVPDHALAMSTIISDQIVAISLKKEEALQYLRKEEVHIETAHKGWALVRYENHNLGWIKILPNRYNNYYPSNWRIMMQNTTTNDTN